MDLNDIIYQSNDTDKEKLLAIVQQLKTFPVSARHFLAGFSDEDGDFYTAIVKVADAVHLLAHRIEKKADSL